MISYSRYFKDIRMSYFKNEMIYDYIWEIPYQLGHWKIDCYKINDKWTFPRKGLMSSKVKSICLSNKWEKVSCLNRQERRDYYFRSLDVTVLRITNILTIYGNIPEDTYLRTSRQVVKNITLISSESWRPYPSKGYIESPVAHSSC